MIHYSSFWTLELHHKLQDWDTFKSFALQRSPIITIKVKITITKIMIQKKKKSVYFVDTGLVVKVWLWWVTLGFGNRCRVWEFYGHGFNINNINFPVSILNQDVPRWPWTFVSYNELIWLECSIWQTWSDKSCNQMHKNRHKK